MGIIVSLYKKKFLCRYDKDGFTPYLSVEDFEGLKREEGIFRSSAGVNLAYFYYYYDGYDKDKLVVFCHGLGAGHTAYLHEIQYLCKSGFKVLTLDFTGCDRSGGESSLSLNRCSKDVVELITHLSPKEEVVIVGHSLGGYAALNAVRMLPNVKKGVVMSGFLDKKVALTHFIGSKFMANIACRYEDKLNPDFKDIDNFKYLEKTTDRLMFVASKDDPLVEFDKATGLVQTIKNDNLSFIIEENKKHNPNYSPEALKYMRETFGTFARLCKEKKIKTLEEKKAYFADKSAFEMTVQDERVMSGIVKFIKSK